MCTNLKIDYIELPAADFGVVQRFYEEVFDWEFTDYGEGYRAFSDGRLQGGFYRSDLRSSVENGAALVIVYATDLEATSTAVETAGGTIVKPTFDFPGGRRFEFADPHGNDLAVWTDNTPASG